MKGIYKYTDLKTGEIVYVGKDSHIDKNQRHKDHLKPSNYDGQQINRVLQNNPDRYKYSVIWATEDCSTLKLNKMEILFGKIYDPKFNYGKFGKGGCNGHSEETRKKLSEIGKGRKHTEETKQKMSEAQKGENHPFYGKYHSDETKITMSKTKNTSGYLNVTKKKCKTCKQGFTWKYQYTENGKRKYIGAIDINKLEEKVKAKGLLWKKLK